LLYHLENPLQSLRNMAAAGSDMLLLETIICDHNLPIVRIDDESKDFNQALAGIACRVGFPYVYAPITPPVHEDFRFEWKNNLDCSRDGHNLRCMFVASRKELHNPKLVSLLAE
jgi:hypothetical protein